MFESKLMMLERIWKFLWKDDSVLSWIISIILAFLIVKFLIYPFLGLILGTGYPIVAVVSGSMEHSPVCNQMSSDCKVYHMCGKDFEDSSFYPLKQYWNFCGKWYEDNGIYLDDFNDFSFKNGFNKGDVMVLIGREAKDIKIGDIVVFDGSLNYPIIHRVVNVWEEQGKHYVKTKGDNNNVASNNERKISDDELIGKAIARLPLLGWVKIKFNELIIGALRR